MTTDNVRRRESQSPKGERREANEQAGFSLSSCIPKNFVAGEEGWGENYQKRNFAR